MPAAAWAARSGDPVLFVRRDERAGADGEGAASATTDVPVYVLGPESAIGAEGDEGHRAAGARARSGSAPRIPVENSIAFARYSNGDFGWNINDPGHGFVIANTDAPAGRRRRLAALGERHLGAAAGHRRGRRRCRPRCAATCSTSSPATKSDPTRALYNHVWLVGDPIALSVDFQAQVDELAEVAPVTSGSGSDRAPAPAVGTRGSSPTTWTRRRRQRPNR